MSAGNDANSRRFPFFRHHKAQQGPGCKFRVAELAALKLLSERGLIEIPPPRRTSTYVGESGRRYEVEQIGEAIKEAIIEHRLVSSVRAILTLESGRQVVLMLRGHQEVGELGSVFAVIEVQVNDPEVAWMSPEEIVARSSLDSEWLRIVHHQDDARLTRMAEDEARNQALEQLDIRPDELGLPVGATRKQASESLIHWAIKDALLSLGRLRTPEFRQNVSAAEDGGELHTVEVFVPSTWLSIADVADEVLFDGYRPDIVCVGHAEHSILGQFRLLVEVAVTHKVTLTKLDLIKRDDVACIELDVMRFGQGGQVSLSQLRQLVAEDLQCKAWLHHARISQMLAEAQLKANAARDAAVARKEAAAAHALAKAQEGRKRARQAQAEAEGRQAWAGGLSRYAALRELRLLLEHRWAGRKPVTANGMVWADGEFEAAVAHVISRFELGKDVVSDRGVARRLSEIVRASQAGAAPLDYSTLVTMMDSSLPWERDSWVGLLHQAMDHCNPAIRPDQQYAYDSRRQQVFDSLSAGATTYVRQVDLDPVLASMFPELRKILEQDLGTNRYCERIWQAREEVMREAQAKAEAQAIAAAAEKAERDAALAAERERSRLPDAIKQITYSMNWRQNLKVPANADEAVRCLTLTGHTDRSQPTIDLVMAGWVARNSGISFSDWFASRSYESAEHAEAASTALNKAFLIQQKHRQA
ncbi:hypothetical protein [Paucibacter sp. M5-1]|uniref:hypothetical protein n=1 Tax=Paucibacter sp. M5-1 TaxID=3015998 RepID=UPI0022B898D1|nr:hypothetical protein [Paucibacter sp. M5-1]MCZ7881233.1 hypothetical protein [Paucibacter sp. M5-1]